jgi:hypothetical protein
VFWVRTDIAAKAAAAHRIPVRQWPGHVAPGTVIICSAFGDLNQANNSGAITVLMEHGAGQTYQSSHASYAGGSHAARDNVSLFLVPGQRPAEKLRAKHPRTPVVEIGCPKLDKRITKPRPERQTDKPTVVFSFHWDCKVVPETTSAFPFFRRGIELVARRNDYRVLGHAHPRAMKSLRPWYQTRGIEVVEHFDSVLEEADVYVCDNSSTIFEASAVGIPVVLMNSPRYRREVEHGVRFWEAADIGPNANRAAELPRRIAEALNPSPEQQAATERAVNLIYSVRDGSSTIRAVEAIQTHVLSGGRRATYTDDGGHDPQVRARN